MPKSGYVWGSADGVWGCLDCIWSCLGGVHYTLYRGVYYTLYRGVWRCINTNSQKIRLGQILPFLQKCFCLGVSGWCLGVSGGDLVVSGGVWLVCKGCLGMYQYQIHFQKIMLGQILPFLPMPSYTSNCLCLRVSGCCLDRV